MGLDKNLSSLIVGYLNSNLRTHLVDRNSFVPQPMKNALLLIGCLIAVDCFATVKVSTVKRGDATDIYVSNTHVTPVTITFEFQLENARLRTSAKTAVCLPRKKIYVNTVSGKTRNQKWSFTYTYLYKWGSYLARHNKRYKYNIPLAVGEEYLGGQGFGGKISHTGNSHYAIDMIVDEGTKVYPARPGRVIEVIDHFKENGRTEAFKKKGNALYILHSDGSIGKYVHFSHEKIFVKVGQGVSRNTLLGLSGNTGFSTRPHLHFEVIIPKSGKEYMSREFSFFDEDGNAYLPKKGVLAVVDR